MNEKQPSFGNGKICYIELPSNDPVISSNFYKAVFGWHIRERGDGDIGFDDSVTK